MRKTLFPVAAALLLVSARGGSAQTVEVQHQLNEVVTCGLTRPTWARRARAAGESGETNASTNSEDGDDAGGAGRAASTEARRQPRLRRKAGLARALADAFADAEAVEVVEGDLLDLACDAVVSPANSFGDMSGGIDKAIDDFHRGEAQRRVRSAIAEQFLGELPVGAALIVEVPGRRFPFVVAAPTMRVPGNVAGTINAYLALRAALVAVLRYNAASGGPIRSLAVPGLATGVGGMGHAEAAEQMRTAYDSVIGERWRQVVHPALAPYAMRETSIKWRKS